MLAIHKATKKGNVKAVKSAINHYPHSIDIPDADYRQTPLHIAAQYGYDEIIETLIERGSRAFGAIDIYSRTPLLAALKCKHIRSVGILLLFGSYAVDISTETGHTPMHEAIFNLNNTFLIETFMRFGCTTIDAVDRYGNTPLHYAAVYGSSETVETLIRFGSQSIDSVDRKGRLPFDEAYSMGTRSTMVSLYILGGLQYTTGYLSQITEEERYDVRYSVYFHQSLSARLLFANDRLNNQRLSSTTKNLK